MKSKPKQSKKKALGLLLAGATAVATIRLGSRFFSGRSDGTQWTKDR